MGWEFREATAWKSKQLDSTALLHADTQLQKIQEILWRRT